MAPASPGGNPVNRDVDDRVRRLDRHHEIGGCRLSRHILELGHGNFGLRRPGGLILLNGGRGIRIDREGRRRIEVRHPADWRDEVGDLSVPRDADNRRTENEAPG